MLRTLDSRFDWERRQDCLSNGKFFSDRVEIFTASRRSTASEVGVWRRFEIEVQGSIAAVDKILSWTMSFCPHTTGVAVYPAL